MKCQHYLETQEKISVTCEGPNVMMNGQFHLLWTGFPGKGDVLVSMSGGTIAVLETDSPRALCFWVEVK